nr:hypothetical protein [Tanacetum cinerariifolium]
VEVVIILQVIVDGNNFNTFSTGDKSGVHDIPINISYVYHHHTSGNKSAVRDTVNKSGTRNKSAVRDTVNKSGTSRFNTSVVLKCLEAL